MNDWETPLPGPAQPPPLPTTRESSATGETPLELAVRCSVPYGSKTDVLAGKGRILVTPETLCVQIETPERLRELTGKNEIYQLQVAWEDVRELKSLLAETGVFSVDVGEGTTSYLLRFRVLSGDVRALEALLAALPEEVRLDKCAKCGRGMREGVCPQCGTTRKAVNNGRGLAFIGVGLLLACLGLLFTAASRGTSANGTYTIYYGLVVVGALSVLRGIIFILAGGK